MGGPKKKKKLSIEKKFTADWNKAKKAKSLTKRLSLKAKALLKIHKEKRKKSSLLLGKAARPAGLKWGEWD
jgi:hypothetical protein